MIELDFILLNAHIVRHLREIKYSGKIERVVNVQVYVEKRLLKLHWVQFPVKGIIILVFQFSRLLCPRRVWIIHDIVNFLRWRFVVFFCVFGFWKGFGAGSEFNRNRHKLVIFYKQLTDAAFFQKLGRIVGYVKDNLSPSFLFVGLFNGKFRRTVAGPVHRWLVFVAFGDDFHLFCNHKRRIKPKTEMPNNAGILSVFVLVFFNEFLGARKSDFVDVFFNLFLRHPNSLVDYAKLLFLFVQLHFNNWVAVFHALGFTDVRQMLHF